MRYLMTLATILGLIFSFLMYGVKTANAGEEYNKAVIGHVIQSKLNNVDVDVSVLEAEMSKLAYNFALEMTGVIEEHLPNILESLAVQIRLQADKEYKCSLLKDSKIKDDC